LDLRQDFTVIQNFQRTMQTKDIAWLKARIGDYLKLEKQSFRIPDVNE
jgi:hypothetical protein